MAVLRTETFIHELPLRVTPAQERELAVRFDCARQLYNACLDTALKRLKLMHESRAFRKTRVMKRGRERTATFRRLDEKFGFREYDLHAVAIRTKNACHIGDHLDAHVAQKVASRAFAAVREYAFGRRGRPRFRGRRGLHSLEGKSNSTGIRWRDGAIHWMGLVLPALFDPRDRWGVEAHALSCRVKYVHIVRRPLRGRVRYYAQLVLEGTPLRKAKHRIEHDIAGLDLGPSTIAAVGENTAFLETFCPAVERDERAVRRLRRKMDRSLRAANPDCYDAEGRIVKRPQRRSKRYRRLQASLAELSRREAAHRKTEHGRLCNRVLALGNIVKTEKISYRAWQRSFRKSVAKRAPGLFVSLLRRKAENADGEVVEFPTRSTKLSQTCLCGRVRKKPLSLRQHDCECGVHAQRDLFSAFLARFVTMNRGEAIVDISQAIDSWRGAEPLLSHVVSTTRNNKRRLGRPLSASFGFSRSRSRSHGEERLDVGETVDAVAIPTRMSESHGEPASLCPQNPTTSVVGVAQDTVKTHWRRGADEAGLSRGEIKLMEACFSAPSLRPLRKGVSGAARNLDIGETQSTPHPPKPHR